MVRNKRENDDKPSNLAESAKLSNRTSMGTITKLEVAAVVEVQVAVDAAAGLPVQHLVR